MTEEQKELFKSAGFTEDELQYCYVSADGLTFPPLKDKDGKTIKTGEQYYKEDYLNPPSPQPTTDDLLRAKILKDNANTQLQLSAQQKLNADILLKLAKVGGSTNV